jgi:hypothetical protein
MTKIKDTILERIHSGQVAMLPRWKYVLRTLLLLSGIMLAAVLFLYSITLALFVLRSTGVLFVPIFGFSGISTIIWHSPWILIGTAGVFFTTLYILIRHYGHNYRQPAILSLFFVVVFMVGFTVALDTVSVHPRMERWSENRHIPGLSPLYKQQLKRPDDITPGTITAISDGQFILNSPDGVYTVQTDKHTRGLQHLQPNENKPVLVFGPQVGSSTIKAFGIRPLPPSVPLRPQDHRR